jgi:Alkylmercury lyase
MALIDVDDDVRLAIYRYFIDDGRAPVPAEVGRQLGISTLEAERSFRRLADAHILVLAEGTPYIWMANPFCASPSPFRVEAGGRTRWGICIWDALGVLTMLDRDGTVDTFCPDCSEPLQLEVRNKAVTHSDEVVHFSVPAAHFWDDIGFT